MPIDKSKLLQMLFDGENEKKQGLLQPMKVTKTKDDTFVTNELSNTFEDSKDILRESVLEKVVPFILWNNSWNEYGIFSINNVKRNYWRYASGQIVYVDFGCGNIKTELSFPHPAIVLYNFAQTAIVLPITTDDKKTAFDDEIEDVVIKATRRVDSFPNDSIINLHQPKAIHKERIIKKFKYNTKKYIVDDMEIERLNSRIGIDAFKKNMSLFECIQLKYTLMFNRALYDEKAKLLEERNQLIRHINDIEEMLNNLEKDNVNAIKNIKSKVEKAKISIDS